MDLKNIKRLIDIVEASQISGLRIEEDNTKIEIKKELTVAPAAIGTTIVQEQVAAQPIAPQPADVPAEKSIEDDKNLIVVKSPMVGTFYSAPNPEAKPFVKIGDRIGKGEVICIIEAMKLFNEIESEHSGVVEKILIDNANPVEYGQDLFVLRIG